MTIYKRGTSFMVSVGSGARRYRQTFRTLKDAEEAEAQALLRQKASGSPLEGPTTVQPKATLGHTLKEVHDLTWRLYWREHDSAKTIQINCRAIFRVIPELTPIDEITPAMVLEAVEEWEDEGNSGSTVNRKISTLSMMLKTAAEQGWIGSVPKLPRRKEGKHRIRWMNDQEELRALSACQHLGLDELRDVIIVAVDTGFRRGELLGLSPSDHFNGQLHLHAGETKTDRARAVPVTTRVEKILTKRGNQRKIFSLSPHQLRYQWNALKAYMGLEDDPQFVVHMLRHTCASRLVQRGVPLAVVQQWMGHSNIMTTMRYAHMAPDSLSIGREALEQGTHQPQLKVVNG
jgi:integrase